MLARMPWADARIMVSSMRMMHEPRVFQRVVELLVSLRPAELETREGVGGGATYRCVRDLSEYCQRLTRRMPSQVTKQLKNITPSTPHPHVVLLCSCEVLLSHTGIDRVNTSPRWHMSLASR